MKKFFLFFLIISGYGSIHAQVFSDNFDRANNTSAGNGWIELETSSTGSQILSNRLQLGSTTAGRELVYRDVSSLYTTNGISENTGLLVWAFNFRQTRPDPSGFGNSSYGVAFILGKTTIAPTDGNGYAIIIGQSLATDPIRLVSFTNGPD